jgi:hypothetical protein
MEELITTLALGMLFCTASMVNTASATTLYGAMGAGYDDNAPVKSKNGKVKISKKKQRHQQIFSQHQVCWQMMLVGSSLTQHHVLMQVQSRESIVDGI